MRFSVPRTTSPVSRCLPHPPRLHRGVPVGASVCLLLVLAGCGGSGSASDGTGATTATPSSAGAGGQDAAQASASSAATRAVAATVSYVGPSGQSETLYPKVACSSYGKQGDFAVLASNPDDGKATLSVVVKNGKYDQLGFTTNDGHNWMAAFGGSEPANAARAPRTSDGTLLDLDGVQLSMSDMASGDTGVRFTLTGRLACTSGRIDTGDVVTGDTGDVNTLRVTGARDEELRLGEVLCRPEGDGVIAVGQRERDAGTDSLTITVTDDLASVQLSVDKGEGAASTPGVPPRPGASSR